MDMFAEEQKRIANKTIALVQKYIDSGDLKGRFSNSKVTTVVHDATKVNIHRIITGPGCKSQ